MQKTTTLTGNFKKLFTQSLSLYDKKSYTQSLHNVNKILRQYPHNPESLSLKGLLLFYTKTKSKKNSYLIVKNALAISMRQKDLISMPFCFRVYAIMYKEDGFYKKASNAFINSLRYYNDVNVLKDLGGIQMYLYDWQGLVKSREKVMKIAPNDTKYWLSYALGLHKCGEYEKAVKVIDSWIVSRNTEINEQRDVIKRGELKVQRARVLGYKIVVMFDEGRYKDVIDVIEKNPKDFFDKTLVTEIKGKCYLKIGDVEKARETYTSLLNRSPDNSEYFKFFISTLGIKVKPNDVFEDNVYSKEESKKILEFFDGLKISQNSMLLERIKLTYSYGEDFKLRFILYIQNFLLKTIPSLFNSVISIYKNENKVKIIEDLLIGYKEEYDKSKKFPLSLVKSEEYVQSPTIYLWVLLFLARHFDQKKDYKNGLQYINEALKHTPTLPELYLVKGRILKHLRMFKDAANTVDIARRLDLADRFLNTKSTKYYLLDNQTEKAHKVAYEFAQDQEHNFNLKEMNGIKYMYNLGMAYKRKHQLMCAFLEFQRVKNCFLDNIKTFVEFNEFYLNKCCMVGLIDSLEYFRVIKKNPMYLKSITHVIEIFLLIHNNQIMVDRDKIENMKDEKEIDDILKCDKMQECDNLIDDLIHFSSSSDMKSIYQLAIKINFVKKDYKTVCKYLKKYFKEIGNNKQDPYLLRKIAELDQIISTDYPEPSRLTRNLTKTLSIFK